MAYLIPSDYQPSIQDVQLSQILNNKPYIQAKAELAAQAEAVSYLKQRYDVSGEFTDTMLWSAANTCNAADRVYLNAPSYVATANTSYTIGEMVLFTGSPNAVAYVTTGSYAVGNYTLYCGSVYKCTVATTGAFDPSAWAPVAQVGYIYECTANTTGLTASVGNLNYAGLFDPTAWTLKGLQYQIFYAVYPKPLFDLDNFYNIGDQVFRNGKVYTCIIPTPYINHDEQLQFGRIENIPVSTNVFPDDPVNGIQSWGTGIPYTVPANTDILNAGYWTVGDNRDQQMVEFLVYIVLYRLHMSIAPRNVPELRVQCFQQAINWLQMAARGEVTPVLPLLQPDQGGRIRFGGNVRQINYY